MKNLRGILYFCESERVYAVTVGDFNLAYNGSFDFARKRVVLESERALKFSAGENRNSTLARNCFTVGFFFKIHKRDFRTL